VFLGVGGGDGVELFADGRGGEGDEEGDEDESRTDDPGEVGLCISVPASVPPQSLTLPSLRRQDGTEEENDEKEK